MSTLYKEFKFNKQNLTIIQSIKCNIDENNKTADGIRIKFYTIDHNDKRYSDDFIIFLSNKYQNTIDAFKYLSNNNVQEILNSLWISNFMNNYKRHNLYEWIITNNFLVTLNNQFEILQRNNESRFKNMNTCMCSYNFFEMYDSGMRYLS
jgi:hypothetical protein